MQKYAPARTWLVTLLVLTACSEGKSPEGPPAAAHAPAPITNRVVVSAAVRQNLGITFVKAEERAVSQTLRLTGHFGLPPSARLPHHTALSGVVQVYVAPLERVEEGHLLASVASPSLLEHRHQLHLASDSIGVARDGVALTSDLVDEASATLAQLRKRNTRLKSAGAVNADLVAQQAALVQRIKVLRGQRSAKRREVTRAEHRFDAELLAFSSLLGVPGDDLRQEDGSAGDHGDKKPRWETVDRVEIHAAGAGVVSDVAVSTGAWVGAGAKLVEVHDPNNVWLVARALTSDVSRLKEKQVVQVLGAGRGASAEAPIPGTLQIGVSGDAVGRTVTLYVTLKQVPTWARPGTAGFVEVAVSGGDEPEVAIPLDALVRDELQDVSVEERF